MRPQPRLQQWPAALHDGNARRTLRWLLEDIAAVAFACWLVSAASAALALPLVALAVLLVARAQSGLVALLHDRSHRKSGVSSAVAAACRSASSAAAAQAWLTVAETCAGELLLEAAALLCCHDRPCYIKTHKAHHSYLKSKRDPDHGPNDTSLRWYREPTALTAGGSVARHAVQVWAHCLADLPLWRSTVFGALNADSGSGAARRASIVSTWLGLLLTVGLCTSSASVVASIAALWWGTRASVFFGLTMFRELCDHFVPPPTDPAVAAAIAASDDVNAVASPMAASPTFPSSSPSPSEAAAARMQMQQTVAAQQSCTLPSGRESWLAELVHPHDDNYHTLHHMWSSLPLASLRAAHAHLTQTGHVTYLERPQYDGYFFGRRAAVRDIVAAARIYRGPAAATQERRASEEKW